MSSNAGRGTEGTPVFSMRSDSGTDSGQPEDALVSDLAKVLTGAIKAGRLSGAGFLDFTRRVVAIFSDRGADVLRMPDIGAFLDDIYALLGIASTSALLELDERIDEVELHAEDRAREHARRELLLLHQRIGELEAVMHARNAPSDPETDAEIGTLIGQLSDLEARIDAMPWPARVRPASPAGR